MHKIKLIDETIRDGLQIPGVSLNVKQKINLACKIIDAGITEVIGGIPARGSDDIKIIKTLSKKFTKSQITPWCRAVKDDIQKAALCNTKSIHISILSSEILQKAFNKNFPEMLQTLPEIISLAKKYFDFISIGLQDASRASFYMLSEIIKHAGDINRIRIADTVGILTPQTTAILCNKIKSMTANCIIEFHAHNDFGLATANTLSALTTGADCASVTVNGYGERSGNAALEEVAVAFSVLYDCPCGVELKKLIALCNYTSKIIGIAIPNQKAICGKNVFTHEAKIHRTGSQNNPLCYLPFNPKKILMNSQ